MVAYNQFATLDKRENDSKGTAARSGYYLPPPPAIPPFFFFAQDVRRQQAFKLSWQAA